ncbi:alpha/beta hydrolase [Brumimicrobium salinarum]|uniref:alpha/beta hydrolase n=1 Tax=Brumimicrobium salinarum TaxID=2058658 RepID=UPI001F0C89D2|nr:alpha/beta fold hydrolase [Brumimicrobium salinarum]
MKNLKWFLLVSIFFIVNPSAFAQKEKEIKVKIDEGKLYGTLLKVEDHKSAPIVLIIPGSGPTDRNGNSLMLQANSYRMLAENLAENGISSLRYDKLMIGKSESSIEEKDLRFETNVKQVTALIDYLSKKKFENIILLGHSEGSLIGVLAAQQRSISKFISLAGTGRAIDEVLIQQIKEQNPNFEKEVNNILETLKQGDKVDDFSPELASLFRKSVQPYLISWLKYNPKDEIRKLEIPILILHGSTDIQVTKKDALLQKEGNDEAELKIIKGMNQRN